MSKIFDNLELTSSNIKLLYIEHIIKLHQRKPIVTDSRSKKISNTLQVNEADSFGIKSCTENIIKFQVKGQKLIATQFTFSSPYINRIKFRVFILFHTLRKNMSEFHAEKRQRVKIIYIYIPYSTRVQEENISRSEKSSCIKP